MRDTPTASALSESAERPPQSPTIAQACKEAELVPRFVLCRHDKRLIAKRWQSVGPAPSGQ